MVKNKKFNNISFSIALVITLVALTTIWLVSFQVIDRTIGIAISSILFGMSPIAWMAYIVGRN